MCVCLSATGVFRMLLHRQEGLMIDDLHVHTVWRKIRSAMSTVRINPHSLVVVHSPHQCFLMKQVILFCWVVLQLFSSEGVTKVCRTENARLYMIIANIYFCSAVVVMFLNTWTNTFKLHIVLCVCEAFCLTVNGLPNMENLVQWRITCYIISRGVTGEITYHFVSS